MINPHWDSRISTVLLHSSNTNEKNYIGVFLKDDLDRIEIPDFLLGFSPIPGCDKFV